MHSIPARDRCCSLAARPRWPAAPRPPTSSGSSPPSADLKALTEAVGGDLVEVDSLARGNQNPHDVEVRPSLMVKLRRADLLVINGLELDQWADVVVQGANNPKVCPGAPGRVDASRGIQVLEVPTTRVDRSMGDVHPLGNPHYTPDPGLAPHDHRQHPRRAGARGAPSTARRSSRTARRSSARLDAAMRRWTATIEPFKGAKVVHVPHRFHLSPTRFGLVQGGTIEDRPGIPPRPRTWPASSRHMKQEKIKVVVVEPWND